MQTDYLVADVSPLQIDPVPIEPIGPDVPVEPTPTPTPEPEIEIIDPNEAVNYDPNKSEPTVIVEEPQKPSFADSSKIVSITSIFLFVVSVLVLGIVLFLHHKKDKPADDVQEDK